MVCMHRWRWSTPEWVLLLLLLLLLVALPLVFLPTCHLCHLISTQKVLLSLSINLTCSRHPAHFLFFLLLPLREVDLLLANSILTTKYSLVVNARETST